MLWFLLIQQHHPYTSSFVRSVDATKIQWIPAKESNTNNIDAAAAPKSQRYWDEHKILRPDYAKTDEELAAEGRIVKTTTTTTTTWIWILLWTLGLAGVIRFLLLRTTKNTFTMDSSSLGHRLVDSPPIYSPHRLLPNRTTVNIEQCRAARLARFQENQTNEES
jgi:hypothetical protein